MKLSDYWYTFRIGGYAMAELRTAIEEHLAHVPEDDPDGKLLEILGRFKASIALKDYEEGKLLEPFLDASQEAPLRNWYEGFDIIASPFFKSIFRKLRQSPLILLAETAE